MSLSVIIPSRNIDNLRPCVAAVRKHEPEARIIVVDDSDNDSSIYSLCMEQGCWQYVGCKPFVFSRNVNIGIRAAGDDDVILLNDDALLESPGGFSLMQEAARQAPEFGIIGAVTNQTGARWQRRENREQSVKWRHDAAFTRIGYDAAHRHASQHPGEPLDTIALDGLRECEHIAFVCVLIPARTRDRLAIMHVVAETDPIIERDEFGKPRAIYQNISKVFTGGLLDERFNVGYGSEDLDYCMQVRHAGLKVGVHDGCFVDHNSLHSSFRGAPAAPGDIWANHRILRAKWGMPPNPADPEYAMEVFKTGAKR